MQNHSKAKTALLGRLSELKSKPTQNRRLPKVGNSDTITVPTHSNIYMDILFCLCLCILSCIL